MGQQLLHVLEYTLLLKPPIFKTNRIKTYNNKIRKNVKGLSNNNVVKVKAKLILCYNFIKNNYYIQIAHFSPSMAADTIPPAYPAPSPHGNKLFMCVCCKLTGSLGIKTGDEVLDSIPTILA